ncbi:MAG: hypothetical protein KDE19_07000, partial [Caldilineaceae bacterium]|nr:hypothetical protein [Caldilineaceae bacterium]
SVELGLTASMPPIIIANGVAEHVLRRFWRRAPILQAETQGEQLPLFQQGLIQFYWRYALVYLVALLLLSVGTQALFYWAIDSGVLVQWIPIPNPQELFFIFYAGLAAYGLLGMGIFSCMFCITVGAPILAVRAVAWGLLATLLIGLPLSGIHYSFSALAFIIGGLFFVVIAWQKCMYVLRSADHRFAMSL